MLMDYNEWFDGLFNSGIHANFKYGEVLVQFAKSLCVVTSLYGSNPATFTDQNLRLLDWNCKEARAAMEFLDKHGYIRMEKPKGGIIIELLPQ
jgi:hypothetical protein